MDLTRFDLICLMIALRKNHPDRFNDTALTRTPVTYVHVDQTHASTLARVHRHLPPHLASYYTSSSRRYQLLNLWRPISHPAHDRPLTLCDYRTVNLERDMEPQRLVFPEGMEDGETWGVKYHKSHRWVYQRGMKPDECVLIKWYVCYVMSFLFFLS